MKRPLNGFIKNEEEDMKVLLIEPRYGKTDRELFNVVSITEDKEQGLLIATYKNNSTELLDVWKYNVRVCVDIHEKED
jgi:hypothetical protein